MTDINLTFNIKWTVRYGQLVLLLCAAGVMLFARQSSSAPVAVQHPQGIVSGSWEYDNPNCEGRPNMKFFTLDKSRFMCSPADYEPASAVGTCKKYSSGGGSYNATCKPVKADWETPPPGYMCRITYGADDCSDPRYIATLNCFTMESLGTCWPSGGSPWSLTPVPKSAGTSADTMILAFRNKCSAPQTVKNGQCNQGMKYVW